MSNKRHVDGRGVRLTLKGLWLSLAATAIWAFSITGVAAASEPNTVALSIEPTVPKVDEPFRVTASGTVSATESSNVVLIVVLGPAERTCSTSGALEQAQGERGDKDAGWGVWWDSYLGRNNPMGVSYEESKIFDGRPLGRYRICAYTIGQGEGPDPYAATTLDLTVGGTCAAATRRAHAHRKQLTRVKKDLQQARKALRRTLRKGNVRRLKAARRKVQAKRRALKKTQPRLANALETRKALCG